MSQFAGAGCGCNLSRRVRISWVKISFVQSFKKLRRRVRSHRKSGRLGRKKHPNSLSKLKKSRAFSVNPCRAGKCPKKQKNTLEFQLGMFWNSSCRIIGPFIRGKTRLT